MGYAGIARRFARFELDEMPAGIGQSAAVYRAIDSASGQECALKIFAQDAFSDDQLRRRFQREVAVMETLNHPAIVRLFDSGVEDQRPWISMGWCARKSLKDHCDLGQAPLAWKVEGLTAIASAIDFSHERGVLHRDLKPSNILIDEQGLFQLTDFGIAKVLSDTTGITSTGHVLGTASYMSPEQAQDLAIGPASDIYSLGVVAYEMVFGHPPFTGANVPVVMLKHVTEAPPIPTGTSPLLSSILRKALAKDPKQRWNSASDMIAMLAEAVADQLQSMPEDEQFVPTSVRAPGKSRALVIDASEETRSTLGQLLKYHGIAPVLAKTGPEALQKLQSGSFEVVIVQSRLDWITGADIAKQVRIAEQRYDKRALIIATADQVSDGLVRECVDAGVDQVISRPIDCQALMAVLREFTS